MYTVLSGNTVTYGCITGNVEGIISGTECHVAFELWLLAWYAFTEEIFDNGL